MWEYGDLFGMPFRKGHTDIDDPERKKNMELMLANVGSAGWAVFDKDDNIDLLQADQSDAVDVFIKPVKLSNEEISKSFAGSTGMFDEKAFVGSAEIQERLFKEFVTFYLRLTTFVVNDDLIPRMQKHGIMPEGVRWRFVEDQVLSIGEKATIIKDLAPFFKFDPATVTTEIGIQVEDSQNPDPAGAQNFKSIRAQVNKLYQPYIIN